MLMLIIIKHFNSNTHTFDFQGVPQHIAIQFEEPQEISSFHIQFQGGFAGKNGCIQLENDNGETSKEDFYPEDINALQTFKLKEKYQSIKKMKIIFNESTDFFGRIIVYKLEMF